MKLLLDTNVLARLCHPTAYRDVQRWFRELLERGDSAPEILIPVLADYEIRRAFLTRGASASLEQLDRIEAVARTLPVTPQATRMAAELRSKLGCPPGADLSDADLVIVAQAQLEQAVLVTSDRAIKELANVVAKDWDAVNLDG
jgi:predicted nucleic acid-binding protein